MQWVENVLLAHSKEMAWYCMLLNQIWQFHERHVFLPIHLMTNKSSWPQHSSHYSAEATHISRA